MKTPGSRFPLRIFFALCACAGAALALFARPVGKPVAPGLWVGHVTRAWGTVVRSSSGHERRRARLETGRDILVPLGIGDRVQTGEDAAARLLFFGGSTLQLQAGTIVSFEDGGEDVAIRMLLGRGFLDLSSHAGTRFAFRAADGSELEVPEGRRLVLELNALQGYEDAIRVLSSTSGASEMVNLENLEMRALAHGEEIAETHPVLVPPIQDRGQAPPSKNLLLGSPRVGYPENEADLDVKLAATTFRWSPARRKPAAEAADPIIGYEITVRPAFGYDIQDAARKTQVFRTDQEQLPLARVGGTGTFLWSVRAVGASGRRSPAAAPRWVELRFPKTLLAPKLMKPRIK